MKNLKSYLKIAEKNKVAIGHFNISDIAALKAIFEATVEFSKQFKTPFGEKTPVMIGVSEGERDFVGVRQAAVLVKSLREEYNWPIFLNADHTHTLAKIKQAAEAGFDEVLFDGGKMPLKDNIKETIKVVKYIKKNHPEILVEGELGYIGSSSEILTSLPEGAAFRLEDLTKPEEAAKFTRETGVDLLAPAVGNIHGIIANIKNPELNIARIRELKEAVGKNVGIVLHGGSGTSDKEFQDAILAGVSIIHINTELRVAWRKGVETGLKNNPTEVAPYKILPPAIQMMKEIVLNRLKIFNRV